MSPLDAATADLRQRLGKGARYDSDAAPALELAWARRGTAYFARKLNELTDDELLAADDLGRKRRSVVCRIGHEARALAQLVEWARLGQLSPDRDPLLSIDAAVRNSTSLPAAAIRYLFKHAEVHLNVEWRDLDARGWQSALRLPTGELLPISSIPARRAVSLWQSTVELENGGSTSDFPAELTTFIRKGAAGRNSKLNHQGS